MQSTGKPTMGVQAMLQQNSASVHGVNMINNNVPSSFSNSSSITAKSPIIITTITPPSPQVTVKNLPSDPSPTPPVSVTSSNFKTTSTTGTTPTPRTVIVTVATTSSSNNTNTNVTAAPAPNYAATTTTTNSTSPVIRPSQGLPTTATAQNSAPGKVEPNNASKNSSGVGPVFEFCSTSLASGGGKDTKLATDVSGNAINSNSSIIGDPQKLGGTTNSDVGSASSTAGGIGIRGGSGGKLAQGTGGNFPTKVSEPQSTKTNSTTPGGPIPITTTTASIADSCSTSSPGFGATTTETTRANLNGNHQPNKVANNQISSSATVTGTRTSNSSESSAKSVPTSSGATSASGIIKPGKMDYQQNGVGVIDTFTNGAATAPSGDTPTAKSAESNGNHGGGIVSDSDSESHQQQKSRPTAAGDHANLNQKLANVKNGLEEKNGSGGGSGRLSAKTASPSMTRPHPTGPGSRPSTASRTSVGVSPTPMNKDKTPKSDITGSGKVSGEPNFTRSGRMSTPRAASAKANATTNQTPTLTSTLRENSKSPRTQSRNKSGSGTQDLNARPQSALCTTPRSRPSSTLYQHTASSAQKGIQSPSANLISSGSALKATPSPGASTPKSSSRPSTARPRTSAAKMGDSTAGAAGDTKPATLSERFSAFSKFGDTSSDGKAITLTCSDKWMKQAKVIDGKKITTTDTSIYFKKLFKTTKKVPLDDYKKFVEELAKSKKIEPQELLDKLTNCGPPGLSTATKAAHTGVVDRLTDVSKYTGSHKERFDATGKGKGLSGRVDVADSSGYVASFKEKLDLNKDSPIKGGSPSPTPATKEASPAPAK